MSLLNRIFQTEQLTEAQNYESMFNDFWKLWERYKISLNEIDPDHPTIANFISNSDLELKNFINENILWARTKLKKNDRIVWYLRLIKVAAVNYNFPGKLMDEFSKMAGEVIITPLETKALDFLHDRGEGQRSSEVKFRFNQTVIPALRDNIEHYFSLPIPQIQNYNLTWESFATASRIFGQYEKDWAESRKGMIDYDETDFSSIVMDFNDGFMWVDLGRGACSVEADAMGHCGNVPSARPGDTILSLRHKTKDGKRDVWKPYLTFILDKDGMLGEMKGRANEKPAERYHKYILPLLYQPIIQGIKGGGFAPERNFKVSDLSEDDVIKLLDHRPDFADVGTGWVLFKKNDQEGIKELLPKLIQSFGEGLSMARYLAVPYYDPPRITMVNNMFKMGEYADFEDLIKDFVPDGGRSSSRETLKNIIKFLDDGYDWNFYPDSVESYMYSVIPDTPNSLKLLSEYAQIGYPQEYSDFLEEYDNTVENLCKFLDYEMDDSDFQTLIKSAYDDGARAAEQQNAYKKVKSYINNGPRIIHCGDLEIPFELWNEENDSADLHYSSDASISLLIDKDLLMKLYNDKETYLKIFNSIENEDMYYEEWPSFYYSEAHDFDEKAAAERAAELLEDLGK